MDERQYNMDERQIGYFFFHYPNNILSFPLSNKPTHIPTTNARTTPTQPHCETLNQPTTQPHQAIARTTTETQNRNPNPRTLPLPDSPARSLLPI